MRFNLGRITLEQLIKLYEAEESGKQLIEEVEYYNRAGNEEDELVINTYDFSIKNFELSLISEYKKNSGTTHYVKIKD